MSIIINDKDTCKCGAYWQGNGFCCNGHSRPQFRTIAEVKQQVLETGKRIQEWECPNFDIVKPTDNDLKRCDNGAYCSNHWGCHTFRHFNGTREG